MSTPALVVPNDDAFDDDLVDARIRATVRTLMASERLQQAETSRAIGMSLHTFRMKLAGHKGGPFKVTELMRLARFLGVPLEVLLYGIPGMPELKVVRQQGLEPRTRCLGVNGGMAAPREVWTVKPILPRCPTRRKVA